jgi:poly-beta-1,6-N-acetyl-D-glucosamine synthase
MNSATWFDLAFYAAVALFVYPFAVYPVILPVIAARVRRKRSEPAPPSAELPRLAMVICALNEQKVLGRKLENCLELDYPRERLRVIVVSDGSTDRTAPIAHAFESRGIEVIEQPRRRGKITNLNEVIPALDEDIVVLSDANVIYHRAALRKLAARFQDPTVGCVSGRVVLTNSTPSLDAPTTDYYSLEWRLQDHASALYSMPGADGAMYAFRRRLFTPCPNDTVIEDFVIPMSIVRQGRRVVFEGEALGWEEGVTSLEEEFRRRTRIAAGAAQGLRRGNAWPWGAPLRFWFVFVSHKLLRWLSPLVGIAVVAMSCWTGAPFGRLVAFGFLAMTALALVRLVTRRTSRLLDAPFFFLFSQFAVAVGLVKGLVGAQPVLWAKANR